MNALGPMSSTGMMIGLVAVIGIFAIPIVSVIAHFACAAFKIWQEVGLKRDMVARGYTAQEIIEVVGAKRGSKSKTPLPNVPPAKPIKQPVFTP